ncbi:TPA: restriction endonuclease subunit S [Streptococcus suis]|nr:restriction endonuclease subunit S [Streptococcus suis]HEM4568467.1 restriction endonuclease subunit S [Streptococcus suis]
MTRMKDSGNPWVREIPSDWFEKKLRYLVKLRGEKSVTTDYKKYVGLENIMSQTGQYVQTGIEVDLTENLTFEVGDILFGKLIPYLMKYWRAEFSGTASSEFVIIKGSSLNLNFLFWAIQSDSFINDVDSSTYGSKMPRASWEYMKNIKLPFPESIEEQAKIADFLDKKVAQLDSVKSLLEKQIKTLEDYRQSLIYETVTKGLDKTVPLKDSGVDWIGQIPEGWGIGRLKHFYNLFAGGDIQEENFSVEFDDKFCYPILSNSKENNGIFGYSNVYRFEEGTVTVAGRGDIGYAEYRTFKYFPIIRLLVYVPFIKTDGRFTTYWINSAVIEKNQTAVSQLTRFTLDELPFPKIDLEVQREIADFLDKKTEQINQMIAIKKEQIENINKQRQTLIYDYVTGKRRV